MALVIGNSLYQAAPLTRPTDDVNTITKALRKCNFTVTKEMNLDKKNAERVISEFQQALTKTKGIGFFYFAGHGFQADGENYLIPIDAAPKNKADAVSSAIRLSSVLESMNAAGNRLNIVALEASNAAPFGMDFQPAAPGFADMTPPPGFFLMSAAQPDTVVVKTSDRKSLFTARLSELITTPELDIKEGFTSLIEDILKSTQEKQRPWFSTTIEESIYLFSLKRTNSIGMDFVYIPPGKFVMGSPFDEPGRGKDENQKTVTIGSGFFMQTTEVTQAQWMALMERNPSNFDECGGDCPVESVSWSDVQEFIERLNKLEKTERYRLPTEAEWEYATRSGNGGWFCFGNDPNRFPEYAWYKGNAESHPHPVAQKKPNDWGLYDVHGNVWEWCQDKDGEYRLARGGSWYYPMRFARSANRFFAFQSDRNYTIGFRLVMAP